ncbi:penicillin-binding protein activator [Marinibactrum halimedae]|uniref:Penicillin-binding protein activator n=1 Tax=Marinibactrum halimedae TaxID=1444977 RepID=A0AA37T5Y2_9GAMM|nr:penicillin-binding protein activator [Marinibactrum halimedae]MCD9460144.1 penicillin-binding protein activator [Marinibactrum halimedae]GLS26386.1 penicillin-binding protein activator [Marinibactrum halimedae]
MPVTKYSRSLIQFSSHWAVSSFTSSGPSSRRLFPQRAAVIAAFCGALFLGGCGENTRPSQQTATPVTYTQAQVEALLDSAREAPIETKDAIKLKAALALVELGEVDWATTVFSNITPQRLSDEELIDFTVGYSALAASQGEYYIAQRILTNPQLDTRATRMPTEKEMQLRQQRADLFAIVGEPIASIDERVAMMPLIIDPEQERDNNEAIWQTLMSLPESSLQQLSLSANTSLLRGWYSLATISKNNQSDLEMQLQQVEAWQTMWPNHPASHALPSDLELLQSLVAERPQQIALLLPLTGKFAAAGEAVRDGFMAGYYTATARGSRVPEIRVYNTDGQDINALYDLAVSNGAGAVVGPLQKEPLTELNMRLEMPVPTLGLNYTPNNGLDTHNFYQFGLAAEDEGRQTADRAWRDGHRRAMILASHRDWGQRAVAAFEARWVELGGEIIVNRNFAQQNQFSKTIEEALLVDRSKQRAKDLRRLTGTKMEFEPRRRDDVDFIFMVATPGDARQLKPTLAFHYAGDVPVYGTSHLYGGQPDPKSDRDLNGIRFSTLPWLFDQNSNEKQLIQNHIHPQPGYQKLYAMGVDAYHIYPRLEQLQRVSQARYYGATGELRLLENGRVEREQAWAVMSNGEAQLIPTVTLTEREEDTSEIIKPL